jgi:hypothetical protein
MTSYIVNDCIWRYQVNMLFSAYLPYEKKNSGQFILLTLLQPFLPSTDAMYTYRYRRQAFEMLQ